MSAACWCPSAATPSTTAPITDVPQRTCARRGRCQRLHSNRDSRAVRAGIHAAGTERNSGQSPQGRGDEMKVINAGARLDRLPISAFHYRVLGLVGAGMFLDAFEIYLAGGVLAALVKIRLVRSRAQWLVYFDDLRGHGGWRLVRGHFRRSLRPPLLLPAQSADFRHRLACRRAGAVDRVADRRALCHGRRTRCRDRRRLCDPFRIRAAAAARPLGLGAGRDHQFRAVLFGAWRAASIIPNLAWRWMFVIAGVGALIVWYLRRALPESPRWLESKGHAEEAERVLARSRPRSPRGGPLPPPPVEAAPLLPRPSSRRCSHGACCRGRIVGSCILIAINTVIYGFIALLPTFMVKQGMSIVSSLDFTTLDVAGRAGRRADRHVARRPRRTQAGAGRILLGDHRPRRSLSLRSDPRRC